VRRFARVDSQREKLTSQLGENWRRTERVLARYSKDQPARKTASDRSSGHGNRCTWLLAAIRRAPARHDEEISRRQAQLAPP